ncbi:hypothetical protein ASZ90_005712 [hydrocarbon metagenome]|uniref:Uncharacterized protein n=1 Tax=hydrocarbon metagenome TaxID=938273 RepID=A0A0W8FW69_9ZZZZ
MLRIDEQPQIIKQSAAVIIAKNFKRNIPAKEKILITTPLIMEDE